MGVPFAQRGLNMSFTFNPNTIPRRHSRFKVFPLGGRWHEVSDEGLFKWQSSGIQLPRILSRASPFARGGSPPVGRRNARFPFREIATSLSLLAMTNYYGVCGVLYGLTLSDPTYTLVISSEVEKSPAGKTKSIVHVTRRDEGVPPYRRLRRESDKMSFRPKR